jgi:hypothetical protein
MRLSDVKGCGALSGNYSEIMAQPLAATIRRFCLLLHPSVLSWRALIKPEFSPDLPPAHASSAEHLAFTGSSAEFVDRCSESASDQPVWVRVSRGGVELGKSRPDSGTHCRSRKCGFQGQLSCGLLIHVNQLRP